MATVAIREAVKRYGAVPVLHGVSLDVSDGEFVVLVGPSGCGKSTLLRMIAGLEEISGGQIAIGPRVVNDLPPKERDIAMVFQNYALYPHMKVSDNMGFSLKLARRSKAEIEAEVSRAAQILDLEKLLERYPRELSGGQRQRVAMGRAIVRDPSVFLFDEPLSNLDAKLRVAMRAEIKALHQRLRTTTIYVTHDQIEAMTMADRIVVMRDGLIEQIGTPLELYDTPANTFVATFIGSPAMNLLPGMVVAEEGGAAVFKTASGEVWQLPVNTTAQPGTSVSYGIRPEHLVIDPAGIAAEVVVIEPTGAETHVIFRLGEEQIIGVFRERLAVRPGDILNIAPDRQKAHLFDTSTGRRIALPNAVQ
jgi:multiple sugar transport system ATP-binding protein